MMKYVKKLNILIVGSILIVLAVLLFSIKGSDIIPSPENILGHLRDEALPFELSPERGRYALVESIVENKSVFFSKEIAKYVLPDLGFYDGKYVSLFPPGTSIMAIPFYYVGKMLGQVQYFTFLTSSFFAFLSTIFLFRIVRNVTKDSNIAIVSALSYIFGTTAFAYATTLYQHHLVAFGIILGIYLSFLKNNLQKTISIWVIAGLLFFVEYQALLFYSPILILNGLQNIDTEEYKNKVRIRIDKNIIIGLLFFILSLTPFFIYNKIAYGKYYQLAGTVQSSKEVYENPQTGELIIPDSEKSQSVTGFFRIYRLPKSISVLLTSKDRGVLFFSPLILFSVFGLISIVKKNEDIAFLVILIPLSLLSMYGMWGDSWGGWAFGTRYLIPAFAVCAIPLGMAIKEYGNKWYFIFPFFMISLYSFFINLAGGLTTNQIPPSVEFDAQFYPSFTFLHNIKLIFEGKTSSFFYKQFLSAIDFRIFFFAIYFSVVLIFALNYIKFLRSKNQ